MPRYVFCYDIASNRRRRKVAECLESFGDRVQESVFEVKVDRRRFERCLARVRALIELVDDQVAVYTLCARCSDRRQHFGASATAGSIGEEQVFIA